MTKDEYTKRLYIILHYESTTISQAITAIQQLNNEAIGEDEISKAREDKLRQSPPWQRNQLRQELRNILGASNERN